MKLRNVWAIIPARGGSKGIPRKNVRLLAGHPLIAYTVFMARQSGVFDHIIVSTEDTEIEAIAREYGAEVPFRRTNELAEDNAAVDRVLDYTLEHAITYYGQAPDAYAALYPTSPFRTPKMIRDTVNLLNFHYWASTAAQVSCCPSSWYVLEDGYALGISNCRTEIVALRRTGHVLASCHIACNDRNMTRYQEWLAQNKGENLQPNGYHLVDDTIALLDLDSEEDWDTAEWILEHEQYRFPGLLTSAGGMDR